jgi:hypothetical protein
MARGVPHAALCASRAPPGPPESFAREVGGGPTSLLAARDAEDYVAFERSSLIGASSGEPLCRAGRACTSRPERADLCIHDEHLHKARNRHRSMDSSPIQCII